MSDTIGLQRERVALQIWKAIDEWKSAWTDDEETELADVVADALIAAGLIRESGTMQRLAQDLTNIAAALSWDARRWRAEIECLTVWECELRAPVSVLGADTPRDAK